MKLRPAKPVPEEPASSEPPIKRGRGRPKKIKVRKPRKPGPEFSTVEIPRSKLEQAVRFLNTEPAPLVNRGCFRNILTRLNTAIPLRSVNNVGTTIDVARFCAVRHMWPELMQTVAIQCEHPRAYETAAVIRNALYTILADPSLAEPSYLRSFLSSNPACRNEADIDYCIDKILEVFQGVAIIPRWALRGKHTRHPEYTANFDETQDEID